jgi:hypothetical protein
VTGILGVSGAGLTLEAWPADARAGVQICFVLRVGNTPGQNLSIVMTAAKSQFCIDIRKHLSWRSRVRGDKGEEFSPQYHNEIALQDPTTSEQTQTFQPENSPRPAL